MSISCCRGNLGQALHRYARGNHVGAHTGGASVFSPISPFTSYPYLFLVIFDIILQFERTQLKRTRRRRCLLERITDSNTRPKVSTDHTQGRRAHIMGYLIVAFTSDNVQSLAYSGLDATQQGYYYKCLRSLCGAETRLSLLIRVVNALGPHSRILYHRDKCHFRSTSNITIKKLD